MSTVPSDDGYQAAGDQSRFHKQENSSSGSELGQEFFFLVKSQFSLNFTTFSHKFKILKFLKRTFVHVALQQLPGSGSVAAGAAELGADVLPEGGWGQVVVFPAAPAEDADRQALGPQQDAGLLPLLQRDGLSDGDS